MRKVLISALVLLMACTHVLAEDTPENENPDITENISEDMPEVIEDTESISEISGGGRQKLIRVKNQPKT